MALLTVWLVLHPLVLTLFPLDLVPLDLVPLEAPGGSSPRPAVYPSQGNGFASYIVGGFVGLGILILFARWTSRRPKRPS
jgi:hypothetical protein